MKITVMKPQEVDIKTLEVKAGIRYWEDVSIDGVSDEEGTLTPCRVGDYWCPLIDVDSGVITNWEQGKTANIHAKVCDNGSYYLKDEKGNVVLSIEEDYVPRMLCPKENGYGDYIIMNVGEDGKIDGFKFSPQGFIEED
jgi:hypothetical protein